MQVSNIGNSISPVREEVIANLQIYPKNRSFIVQKTNKKNNETEIYTIEVSYENLNITE